jgi:phosphatidylinositol alpha-mannosyltransferase
VVLLEAMAGRTAIVASDLPGYRNVARPDEHALLVPPGDSVALGEAITRVLAQPDLAKSLVSAGEDRAAGYAMAALAERYESLYAELLAEHPRQAARARGRRRRGP